MVKSLKILISLIFLCLIITPNYSQADYNINEGDIYNYDIVKSELYVNINDLITNYMGCNIGTNVPVGEQFQINVTYASSTSVRYNQRYSNWSAVGISSPFYLVDALQYRFDTINYLAMSFSQYWTISNETYTYGLPIESIFFFDLNKNTFSDMEDALTIYTGDLISIHSPNLYIETDTKFKETRKEFQAEWYMTWDYQPGGLTAYQYSIGYKLVYSAIDGSLLGARIKGYNQGILDGTEFDLRLDQQIEQTGYDLDGFEIGEFKTAPGFSVLITFSSIIILSVIVRKRRK